MPANHVRTGVTCGDAVNIDQARRVGDPETMIGLHLFMPARAYHGVNIADDNVRRQTPPLSRWTTRTHDRTL
jgi:hypothetical protein